MSVVTCVAQVGLVFAQSSQSAEEEYAHRTNERTKQHYTTAALERRLGGKHLRIPASYLTFAGAEMPPQTRTDELTLYMLLPDFVGFTPENWQQFGISGNKAALYVHLRAPSTLNAERMIEEFIASGPPRTKAFGFDAYHFDARETELRLPKIHWVEYVIAGRREKGEPIYLICQAPDTAPRPFLRLPADPQCELFVFDSTTGLRIHTSFSQDHAKNWVHIANRLSALLDSWLIN